jgi:hypothetical protein
MSYSNFNSPQLAAPQPHAFIAPGKFLDIDAKFYQQKEKVHPRSEEGFGRMGRPIQPFGTNVNYHATAFVPKAQGLTTQDLKVNYLSYLYNQKTGFDANHKR